MKNEEVDQANSAQLAQRPMESLTRRAFLLTGTVAAGSFAAASAAISPSAAAQANPTPNPSSFLDLLRQPDVITAWERFEQTVPAGRIPLARQGNSWGGRGVDVETGLNASALGVCRA